MPARATEEHGRDIRRQLGPREMASGLRCPGCHGGTSGERSVTASLKGLALRARCWRNKCGWWGQWDITDVGGLVAKESGWRPKRYWLDTLPITDATVAALEARYGVLPLTIARYGLRQHAAGIAAYCPVRSPKGESRGWVRRWLDGTKPKVQGYPADTLAYGEPWQAWFRPAVDSGTGLVVCVEDVFSAMRLAQVGITSVSLLGVHLTALKVAELRNERAQIVLALDADAYGRATDSALRYMVHVRRLAVDIKDMTAEELTQWTISLSSSLRALHHGTPAQ